MFIEFNVFIYEDVEYDAIEWIEGRKITVNYLHIVTMEKWEQPNDECTKYNKIIDWVGTQITFSNNTKIMVKETEIEVLEKILQAGKEFNK